MNQRIEYYFAEAQKHIEHTTEAKAALDYPIMRLRKKEIEMIKSVVSEFVQNADIYLFGSRIDENKRGGDIDLYIVSEGMDYRTKIRISAKLKRLLKKPVDIIIHRDFGREIEQTARKGVIL